MNKVSRGNNYLTWFLYGLQIWERSSSFLPLENCLSGLLLVSVLFHLLQLISSNILKIFVISSCCCIAGDTFPVGCAFDESIVHHKVGLLSSSYYWRNISNYYFNHIYGFYDALQHFKESPDYYNPAYNTKYGVYSEGCGLENVMMSWGHDDYMYLVHVSNSAHIICSTFYITFFHCFQG